jgi:dolichol-phosphate mannosyltransferase
MRKGLVAIPTYNEIENIRSLVESILQTYPDLHVLVIDDHSPDGTGDVVETLQQKDPRVQLIRRPGKLGLGTAYLTAFDHAIAKGYDFVVEMDADFSHHPKFLEPMIRHLAEVDLAIGSRYVPGGAILNWGPIRRAISSFGSLYARWILGIPVRDWTGGFNGWRVSKLAKLPLRSVKSEGYSFQIEMKYLAITSGWSFTEFPITFEDRTLGHSKMSKTIILEAMLRVFQIRLGRRVRNQGSQADPNPVHLKRGEKGPGPFGGFDGRT